MDYRMSEEEKDRVKILKISDDEEELNPEEIEELKGIIEEIPEDRGAKDEIASDEREESEDEGEEEVGNEENISSPDLNKAIIAEKEKQSSDIPLTIEEKAPKIENHIVPTEECWLIKRTKTGFTLPKELRDKIHMQQNFALVFEHHELAFYMINEEDIPKLKLIHKKEEPKPKEKGKGKRSKKKVEGPEPDWPRYFHFEVEDQEKVQDALESAFYKFAANPPSIGEGMNLIMYVLTSLSKNHKMNDARLRQTVIFFLCHIIEQFNQPQLIDFIQREILDDVESPYLYQICLNQLTYTSFIMKKPDKADEFITACVNMINKYDISEMYAIMDSFKHLIHILTPIEGTKIPKEDLSHVKSSLDVFGEKLEDFDYQVQYIEMLERMDFVEDAYSKAQLFLNRLEQDSPIRDAFKEIIRRIRKLPVEE